VFSIHLHPFFVVFPQRGYRIKPTNNQKNRDCQGDFATPPVCQLHGSCERAAGRRSTHLVCHKRGRTLGPVLCMYMLALRGLRGVALSRPALRLWAVFCTARVAADWCCSSDNLPRVGNPPRGVCLISIVQHFADKASTACVSAVTGCTHPLSPHAMHVHPLRQVGRPRIVRTSGVHSKGRFRSRRVARLPCFTQSTTSTTCWIGLREPSAVRSLLHLPSLPPRFGTYFLYEFDKGLGARGVRASTLD